MTNHRLRPADDLLAPAVATTIAQLSPDDVDAGAVRLAKRYAALIDAAHEAVLDAEKAWEELDPDDITGRQYLSRLVKKVEAQSVLAELGPKLLTALEALGATPAGRSKIRKGGAKDGSGSGLSRLREARTA